MAVTSSRVILLLSWRGLWTFESWWIEYLMFLISMFLFMFETIWKKNETLTFLKKSSLWSSKPEWNNLFCALTSRDCHKKMAQQSKWIWSGRVLPNRRPSRRGSGVCSDRSRAASVDTGWNPWSCAHLHQVSANRIRNYSNAGEKFKLR